MSLRDTLRVLGFSPHSTAAAGTAPPVSPAGGARLYYETDDSELLGSFDGSPWAAVMGFGAPRVVAGAARTATNASPFFQRELDAIGAAGGGALFVPAGTYRIRTRLSLPSNCLLFGEGMGATVLLDELATPSAVLFGMVSILEQSNIEIHSLTMRRDLAPPAPGSASYKGIWMHGSVANRVKNVKVHHCECIGILDENFFGQGNLEDVVFHHNRVVDPGAVGFSGGGYNFNGTNLQVKSCAILDNYHEGGVTSFAILSGGDGLIVRGNRIVGFGNGAGGSDLINIAGSRGFICEGNVIENCNTATTGVRLIHIGFDSTTPNELTSGIVQGNIIRDCTIGQALTAACIGVNRVEGPVLVCGNVIENCHPDGAPATPAVTPSAIALQSDGIVLDAATIEDNVLSFGAPGGFSIYGVRVTAGVPAANLVAVGGNDFFGWPDDERHRIDRAPWNVSRWTSFAITPAPLPAAAATDDYAPSGIYAATSVYQDSLGATALNGLVSGADGRMVQLFNISAANVLTLNHEALTSAAGNRFFLPGAVAFAIPALDSVTLAYDVALARWRVIR